MTIYTASVHVHLIEQAPRDGMKRWACLGKPHADADCPLCADGIALVLEIPVNLAKDGRWFAREDDEE